MVEEHLPLHPPSHGTSLDRTENLEDDLLECHASPESQGYAQTSHLC